MTRRAVLAGLALAAPALALAQSPAVPRFVEETDAAGLQSRFDGDWEYTVGGGVAAFDCDGSGLPSLFVAGGANRSKFYRNKSARGGPLRLAAERAGLELTSTLGAYPVDLDGDGVLDLVVLRVGETLLMRGLGDCRFERANERWGFQGGNQWTTAFAAAWLGSDARPTLAFGTYVDRARQDFPWGNCTDNLLLRPARGEALAYEAPLPLRPGHCALGMLFSDWNRSGMPALRITNDREYYKGGHEQLWHIEPGAAPRLFTAAEGWKPLQIWGMGIASADLDGSGYPAYFLTSMADNKLQVLSSGPGRPEYKDIAFASGVTAHRPHAGGDVHPSTAWHAQFADVNNDGRTDLFIVKGNVGNMPDFAMLDPSNLLLGAGRGRFVESAIEAGLQNYQRGRGGLLVDLNADGLLDAVIVNRWDRARLWRNVGAGTASAPKPLGHWLQVRLRQDGGNRDAVGAWLEVEAGGRVQRCEQVVGGGHVSGQLGALHMGLGEATSARVRVLWPGAKPGDAALTSPWYEAAADRLYVLDRQKGLQPWQP
ncbi:MAG: CRTAC1 family protein [Piscinibacter sp.]|uniref:CRTAC1 family protein n=1 Tax=Piscinibacter sp. TaxID=1903157 RepID=UPI00258C6431|nr:CRTAC1 family protein [Piscinibacter sp.]MCW5662686.1 CRTAC1 family protein [Piscinibacter sp.]